MKTKIILMLIVIWTFNYVSGQNAGSIKGRVLDSKTKQTLPSANIYLEVGGSKMGTTTDADGRFTLKPLSAGTYQINVSYVGYNTKVIEATVFPGEVSFIKDIYMSDVIIIGSVDVEADKDKDNARLIDPGQINKLPLKAADIKNIAGSDNIAMVIRAVSSEVQISNDGKDIVFRGSRNGSSACFIDGVRQENLGSTMPGCAVGSIIVYSGGIPAQYGDVTGGIIVLETKSYFDVRAQKRIEATKKKEMNSIEE